MLPPHQLKVRVDYLDYKGTFHHATRHCCNIHEMIQVLESGKILTRTNPGVISFIEDFFWLPNKVKRSFSLPIHFWKRN